VSTEVLIAVVAALPPTLAAMLAFLSSRSVRRQVATPGAVPIGALVERVERRVEALEESVGGFAGRLAHLEGRGVLPLQLDRRGGAAGRGPPGPQGAGGSDRGEGGRPVRNRATRAVMPAVIPVVSCMPKPRSDHLRGDVAPGQGAGGVVR
jgi:hypothetical protein